MTRTLVLAVPARPRSRIGSLRRRIRVLRLTGAVLGPWALVAACVWAAGVPWAGWAFTGICFASAGCLLAAERGAGGHRR